MPYSSVASMVLPIAEILTVREQRSTLRIRSQILKTMVIPAPALVERRLQLPPGSCVAVMERLLLQEATPFALSASYVGLRSDQHDLTDSQAADAIELLEEGLNVVLGESETMLAAIDCDAETAALLVINEGAPILWLEDLVYDLDGRPRAICQLRYRADRVMFSATAYPCRPIAS
jgi:GntR family transcriptional regulator